MRSDAPDIRIASVADTRIIESIPLDQRDLPEDVAALMARGARACEGRDALIFVPDAVDYERAFRWTYAELIEAVESTARGLVSLQSARPPVVAFVLPNLPETHFVLWGGQLAGAVVPVNPLLEVGHIAEILSAAEADIVVTLPPLPGTDLFAKTCAALEGNERVHTLITVNAARYAPGWRRLAGTAAARLGARVPGRRVMSFDALRRRGDREAIALPPSGDRVCALFHTGGTTGTPKIAQLTQAGQITVAWSLLAGRMGREFTSAFCGLPLFHINAPIVTGLAPWLHGATVVLGPPQGYRAPGILDNLWALLAHYRCSAMSAVPTVYQMLLERPLAGHDLSALRWAFCGAAPISVEAFRRFEETTGIAILEGYGFTEGSGVTSVNPAHGERRIGSVGLPLPYRELTLLCEDGQGGWRHAGEGEIGLICERGPNVFKGYMRAEDNANAFLPDPDGGRPWYNSGDLARRDRDGYLWLTGRAKDLIIRGGHNIDPGMIEEALATHEAVEMVAAIGSPDPRVGEVPVAYVTLRAGASASVDDVMAHARNAIAERAAMPRAIHILENMPLTAVGKIFKPALRWQETDRVLNAALAEAIGAGRVQASTCQHESHGQLTSIAVTGAPLSEAEKQSVADALAGYALRWAYAEGAA